MGGFGSGMRAELYNKNRRKLGIYKIYGLTKESLDHYFYIGVTKNYLCKIKSYIKWASKNNTLGDSLLYKKLKEYNFRFMIEEIELLPDHFTEKDAKLYLQENYLDVYKPETNFMNFCYCNGDRKRHLSKEQIEEIVELYKYKIPIEEIAEKYNVKITTIRQHIRKLGLSKKQIIKEIINKIINGYSISKIKEEYSLTERQFKYILRKVELTKK